MSTSTASTARLPRRAAAIFVLLCVASAALVAACGSDESEAVAGAEADRDAAASSTPPVQDDATVGTDGGAEGRAPDVDAAPLPPDGSFFTDSGFVHTPSLVGVQCRQYADGGVTQFTCAPPLDCCLSLLGPPSSCAAKAASCAGFREPCDGPEDCPAGQTCRLVGNVASCGAPQGVNDYCHSTKDCAPKLLCCQPRAKLADGGLVPVSLAGYNNGGCTAVPTPAMVCDN